MAERFENTPEGIHRRLERFRMLLASNPLSSLTGEQRHSMQEEAESLSKKLRSIEESFLTIGLLGGTGVGKSTLMNALAGSEIASASHRRPNTDQVLVYCHKEASHLPSLPKEDLSYVLIPHESDAIRQVLLCDLPDFDSLLGDHRKKAVEFVEHLDLLVWVTSPEKYGDGRFYEFLAQVPKAKKNFIFVLNKTDLLFREGALEQGYRQLTTLARTFQDHLAKQGIDPPGLYVLAAQEALSGDSLSPWNQFASFKQEVFHCRDRKQITTIKASNLDTELQRLFSALATERLNLSQFEQVLAKVEKDLQDQRESWNQAGENAILVWFAKRMKAVTQSYHRDPSHLIGPGYHLAMGLTAIRPGLSKEIDRPRDASALQPPEEAAAGFRKKLEWVKEHMTHSLLRQGLPPSFMENIKNTFALERRFESLGEAFLSAVTIHILNPPLPAFRFFRIIQWVSYVFLLAVFLLAVGGEGPWLHVLQAFGVSSLLQLFISIVDTLFSSRGLAALGTYILLNLFLAFRFYRRYGILLDSSSEKALDVLRTDLKKAWSDCLEGIFRDLAEARKETRQTMETIAELMGPER